MRIGKPETNAFMQCVQETQAGAPLYNCRPFSRDPRMPDSLRSNLSRPLVWLLAALLLALAWGALAPLRYPTRELLFELAAGEAMLPSRVRLTLGVQDVLLLKNSGAAAQTVGPLRLLPGQELRLPFEQGGEYQLASSAHAGGQLRVSVAASPDPGWQRLRWRLAALAHAIRYLQPRAPDQG